MDPSACSQRASDYSRNIARTYPYGIAYHHGSLYLVGWSPNHQEIRQWKVNRIEELHLVHEGLVLVSS